MRKKDKGETQQVEDPKRQKVELKGPRVKHVCRSASIVLGQPIATFPTQEEKQEKVASAGEELKLNIEKERTAPENPTYEFEAESENKAPQLDSQVLPDIPIVKDSDMEIQIDSKKRKIDSAQLIKAPNKAESSEDETVMDLVPRKMPLKPLSNITNVRKYNH